MRTGALVMLTLKGNAYTKRYFNEHWREDANKVGAGDLNLHDNRGTAATLLCEAYATVPELAEAMCWTADKAQRMLDTYLARRGVLLSLLSSGLKADGSILCHHSSQTGEQRLGAVAH